MAKIKQQAQAKVNATISQLEATYKPSDLDSSEMHMVKVEEAPSTRMRERSLQEQAAELEANLKHGSATPELQHQVSRGAQNEYPGCNATGDCKAGAVDQCHAASLDMAGVQMGMQRHPTAGLQSASPVALEEGCAKIVFGEDPVQDSVEEFQRVLNWIEVHALNSTVSINWLCMAVNDDFVLAKIVW